MTITGEDYVQRIQQRQDATGGNASGSAQQSGSAVMALDHSDSIYRRAIESTKGVPYQLCHRDRRYEFIGPGIVELIGVPHDEITPPMFSKMIEEVAVVDLGGYADRHEYKRAFERGGFEQYQVDYRMQTADGAEKWISDRSVLIRHETTGEVTGSLGILRDITERHAVDQALRESQQRFDLAVRSSSGGLWDWNVTTSEAWYSPRYKQLLGYDEDELEASYENWISLVHPDDLEPTLEAVRRHFEYNEPYHVEFRLLTKSGEYRWYNSRGAAIRDAEGKPVRMLGSTYDITPRKQAEEALQQARDELEHRVLQRTAELTEEISQRKRAQQLLQAIAEGTSSNVGEDFFSSVVKTLTATLGIRYAFVCESLDHPTTRSRVVAGCDGQRTLDNFEFEVAGTPCAKTVRGIHVFYSSHVKQSFPDDKHLADMGGVSYCGSPIFDTAGRMIGHLALIDDKPMADDFSGLPALAILASRTAAELARRQAEETSRRRHDALAHMSRISTLGEIATGLAHEINQPLTAITAYAQAGQRLLADLESSEVDDLSAVLEEISQQAMRASEIIRRLRSLVRKAPARRSTVDVNALIEEVIELMKFDRRFDAVRIVLDLDRLLPHVFADRVQLQQVLINLIQNALDALDEVDPRGRTLSIGTSSAIEQTDEEMIEVTVSDTGAGLPQDAEQKVFDAFYSDKPHGLGMGLAISRSIVEEHKGRMWVTSNDQRATTFHFTLSTSRIT